MYSVVEFYGDNWFAEDRPLGKNGRFLEGSYSEDDVATFGTHEQAASACASAYGMRDGGELGIVVAV